MALIELRDVTKSYKRDANEISVLDRVSITVGEGDFLGLMGPSGSGKSTLLNLIGGLDRPTSGAITLDGERLDGLSDDGLTAVRRDKIGFIFQFFNPVSYTHLTLPTICSV